MKAGDHLDDDGGTKLLSSVKFFVMTPEKQRNQKDVKLFG